MKTIQINVPDMSCGHCVHAIRTAVSSIADVDKVEVSLEDQRATVTAADHVEAESLLAAVRDAGYTPLLTRTEPSP